MSEQRAEYKVDKVNENDNNLSIINVKWSFPLYAGWLSVFMGSLFLIFSIVMNTVETNSAYSHEMFDRAISLFILSALCFILYKINDFK